MHWNYLYKSLCFLRDERKINVGNIYQANSSQALTIDNPICNIFTSDSMINALYSLYNSKTAGQVFFLHFLSRMWRKLTETLNYVKYITISNMIQQLIKFY